MQWLPVTSSVSEPRTSASAECAPIVLRVVVLPEGTKFVGGCWLSYFYLSLTSSSNSYVLSRYQKPSDLSSSTVPTACVTFISYSPFGLRCTLEPKPFWIYISNNFQCESVLSRVGQAAVSLNNHLLFLQDSSFRKFLVYRGSLSWAVFFV